LQYTENTTGGLPEKPCGSSMLAAPKKVNLGIFGTQSWEFQKTRVEVHDVR